MDAHWLLHHPIFPRPLLHCFHWSPGCMAIFILLVANYHSRKHVTSYAFVMSKQFTFSINIYNNFVCLCTIIVHAPIHASICYLWCSFYHLQLWLVLLLVNLESIKDNFDQSIQISLVNQWLYSAYHFEHIVLYSILHISL